MKPAPILLLAILAFAIAFGVSQFQAFPGYMDSDYYFAGGLQLVQGKGFTEPYLWNYLDDPMGLPHPSHAYWMPLASIVAAVGMWLTGQHSYVAARLGFMVLAALVPVVTASLAYSLSSRRDLAFVSGLLAVFSMYYAPFLSVPDNYAIYMVLGGTFFLIQQRRCRPAWFVLGILAGLLFLARSDGFLWLALALAMPLFGTRDARDLLRQLPSGERGGTTWSRELYPKFVQIALVLLGFLLVAGAWFWRSYAAYGALLAPGGQHLLWLKSYEETFAYPASKLTFAAWIAQPIGAIIGARLAALRWNLLNAWAAQGGLFLLPFILVGIWIYRKDARVRIGVVGWLALLGVMTVIFPFAGARGGFFHAGAALQCLWWSLAPVGLDSAIAAARRRNLFTPAANKIFQAGLVGLAVLLTGLLLVIRVLPGWGEGEASYPKLEARLENSGIEPGEPVMVRNPPGYYIMTGRPAIVLPYGDSTSMLDAAGRYGARYVLIESAGAVGPIQSVYDFKGAPQLVFVAELNGTRIFRVQP